MCEKIQVKSSQCGSWISPLFLLPEMFIAKEDGVE